MKIKNLVILFVGYSLVFSGSFVPTVEAQTAHESADFLVEIGRQAYERGDQKTAIHEISKALILDPNHALAKKLLAKMGLSDGIYRPQRTSTTKLVELAKHIQDYQKELESLQNEKQSLQGRFDDLQIERDRLEAENLSKDSRLAQLKKELEVIKKSAKAYGMDLTQQKREIQKLKDALNTTQQHVKKDKKFDTPIEKLPSEPYLTPEDYMKLVEYSLDYEDKLLKANNHHRAFKDFAIDQYQHQDMLINALSDLLSLREYSLNDVNYDLVANQFNLLYEEKLLLNQVDQLIAIHDSMVEYRELIKGKDTLIEQQRRDIEYLIEEFSGDKQRINE